MDLALLRTLVPVILVVFFLGIVLSGYVKAPPDKAFIISGYRKTPKILIGRAGVKIPLLERLDVLYLGQMTVPRRISSMSMSMRSLRCELRRTARALKRRLATF